METFDIISVAVQLPFLAIFIWFTLRLLKMQGEERDNRDTEWRLWMDNQRESYLNSLSKMGNDLSAHDKKAYEHVDKIIGEIRKKDNKG